MPPQGDHNRVRLLQPEPKAYYNVMWVNLLADEYSWRESNLRAGMDAMSLDSATSVRLARPHELAGRGAYAGLPAHFDIFCTSIAYEARHDHVLRRSPLRLCLVLIPADCTGCPSKSPILRTIRSRSNSSDLVMYCICRSL